MKILSNLIVAIVLPFIVFVVAPLGFFLGNHVEYTTNLTETIQFLLPIFIILSLILWGILLLVSRAPRLQSIFWGILIGLAASAWIQSQLFAWNFGPLDGRGVDWAAWNSYSYIELSVWFSVISTAVIIAFFSLKTILLIAKNILLLGTLTLFSVWFFSDYQPREKKDIAETSLFSFHEKNNKIIIVLDSFQSDIFQEIMQRWPDEVAFLHGFVYYPNTLGGYPTTQASLPLIMTGKYYKNDEPFKDWKNANYASQNLIDYYAGKNYGTGLISIFPYVLDGIKTTKAFKPDFADKTWGGFARQNVLIVDNGLFRVLPTKLKSRWYDEGRWFFYQLAIIDNLPQTLNSNDIRFLKWFEKKAKISSQKEGEFKVYHFAGTHAPSQLNENFEYENMPDERDSYVRHARGVLRFLHQQLNVMQNLGIYNSAEILVLGDHGRGFLPTDTQGFDENGEISSLVLGGARPLFLYKAGGDTSLVKSSNMPLHLADIVCIFSNSDKQFDCDGYQSALADKQRTRTFFFYSWTDNKNWNKKYMPVMTKYTVNGDVRHVAAWTNHFREYAEGLVKRSANFPSYQLGTPINFGEHGNAAHYLREGWFGQEPNHRWTKNHESKMVLELENEQTNSLLLKLHGHSFLAKDKQYQQVAVEVNGHKIKTWNIADFNWYEALIPNEIIKNGRLEIKFLIAEPTAPCEVSDVSDCRKLGVLVQEVLIEKHTNFS